MSIPLRWLFLDFNSYFASVEQQERAELRGRPVAVVPVLVNTTSCIAASYEAKAFGVKTGTLVAEAKLRCPDLVLVQARHELYVRYHHAIVDVVESCLPIEAVLSIDEMVGRLRGREEEPSEAIALATHLKQTLARRIGPHLRCSVGLAPNRFLAKVAGEMHKPDGLTLLPADSLPDALFRLSLRDLPGIGPNMERRLGERGVFSVQKLCSLGDGAMRSLWGGVEGERYAALLRGEEVDRLEHRHQSLGHSHVLEPAARSNAGAYRVAKRLTDRAAVRLRKMGYWAGGFSLMMKFRDRTRWERRARLTDTQDTTTFLALLKEFWAELPDRVPTFVGVTFSPLIPPQRHTPPLFDERKKEVLAHVMDQINARHGKSAAYFGNLLDVAGKAPVGIAFSRVPELWEFSEDGEEKEAT